MSLQRIGPTLSAVYWSLLGCNATQPGEYGQSLTNTVAMRVLCEATDALLFGITQERAHCILTHKAHATVMSSCRALINVCKEGIDLH